mgnify:CR=1 FL=1|jgi:hypothetical protein
MTNYVVFYRTLTEEQRGEVNSGGWETPVGKAYLDCEPIISNPPQYAGAMEFDLFELAAVAREVEDKEELYHRMQNHEASWTEDSKIQSFSSFPRSMSVGDVVYDVGAEEWSYVASFGFEPVQDETFVAHLRNKLDLIENTSYRSP